MRLAETIYNLRTQKGMSQGDLADALEVSRQSVSKWETGGATPDLDKLVKMSGLFGVTLDELVTGEKAPSMPQPGAEPQVIYVERAREDYPKRKVAALVLFGLAVLVILICSVLGDLLVGVMFSFPFWVCGTICMVFKRRCGLWCGWTMAFLFDTFLRFFAGRGWSGLFGGLKSIIRGDIGSVLIAICCAAMIVLMVCTVRSYGDKVLELTRPVKVKLILRAVLLVLFFLPWQFGDWARQVADSGAILYAVSRLYQVLSLVRSWGQIILLTRMGIDLFAIRRFRKQNTL